MKPFEICLQRPIFAFVRFLLVLLYPRIRHHSRHHRSDGRLNVTVQVPPEFPRKLSPILSLGVPRRVALKER